LTELEKDISTSSNLNEKNNNQRRSRIDYKTMNSSQGNDYSYLNKKNSDELLENEFRSKSLVKLEDKEYSDQIVTTTTTIHTMTTQDIFMQFEESNYYDNDNQLNLINSNNNSNSKTSSSNIYSCLTNYFSDNSNTNIDNFNRKLLN
jgi:hypothetical protein